MRVYPGPWLAVALFVVTGTLKSFAQRPAADPTGRGAMGRGETRPVAPPEVQFTPRRFVFSPNASGQEETVVAPDNLYSAGRGFGFEPPVLLASPEAKTLHDDSTPVLSSRDGFVTSAQPFQFSVTVPEGNYRVAVTIGDPNGEAVATIKAESRRLMVEKLSTTRGQVATATFTVNVRNSKIPPPPLNAPGGSEVVLNDRERGKNGLVLHWDDKLTLEFSNARPCVRSIEITRVTDAITVYLAGDSTVTDQPREPGASWGQMLPRFFTSAVAVANHAESGETMKSFISGLRLAKMLSEMKSGDYLFIQFGHNDEKESWPQTYADAATTYPAYLKVFIAEARRRGAIPVLVSPMQRRTFDAAGKIRNSHRDYPAAVRRVAEEEKVAYIDLSAMSATFYEALGPEKSPLAFSAGGRDATHHDNYGAYELARCIVEGNRSNHLPLADFLAPDAGSFDPAHPDAPENFHLPASAGRMTQPPRGS